MLAFRRTALALSLVALPLAIATEAQGQTGPGSPGLVARGSDPRTGGRPGAFTFDLSGGPGFVWAERRGVSLGGPAVNALGVSAGWFVMRNLSITLRATHLFVTGGKHMAFHGLTAQWYLGRVLLGFGPGFVTFGGPAAFGAQAPDQAAGDRGGLGFLARVGVVAFNGPRHAVNIVWELSPGFLKDTTVFASTVAIEWQFR